MLYKALGSREMLLRGTRRRPAPLNPFTLLILLLREFTFVTFDIPILSKIIVVVRSLGGIVDQYLEL